MELEATIGGRALDCSSPPWRRPRAYPYIHSYFDPPKTLEDLRQNIGPGYDKHHNVEQWSRKDGIPEEWIESPDNIVPIPKLKHWEINRWLDLENEEYLDENGMKLTPRQYIKGKQWEERREFGLVVLRKFGVLK